jgi:hypothetical protein
MSGLDNEAYGPPYRFDANFSMQVSDAFVEGNLLFLISGYFRARDVLKPNLVMRSWASSPSKGESFIPAGR